MIPLVDLRPSIAPLAKDMAAKVAEIIDRGVYLYGEELPAFEQEWAKYCGQKYCVACASGTDALTLAAASMFSDRRVYLQMNTLIYSQVGLLRGGAKLKLIDCDRRGKPSVCNYQTVPVLLYGRYPVKRETRCLLYDACQAHGWRPHEMATACWSFFPTKNLGGIADGGAITTNHRYVAKIAREIRDTRHSRMEEVNAAVLRIKLKMLDAWNEDRRRIATLYYTHLPKEVKPACRVGELSNHHIFAILSDRRDALKKHLESQGVQTKIHYPLYLQPENPPAGKEFFAQFWSEMILSLPMWVGMPNEMVQQVCDSIRLFFKPAPVVPQNA